MTRLVKSNSFKIMSEHNLVKIFLANNLSTSKVIEHLKKHEISIPNRHIFNWAYFSASIADLQLKNRERRLNQQN